MRGRAVELMNGAGYEKWPGRRFFEVDHVVCMTVSKDDRDGNEGMSLSSTASIRLHIGVSSIAAMTSHERNKL